MCDCIEICNKALRESGRNTELELPMYLDNRPLRVFIKTQKMDSKKRLGPVSLTAAYCPFCGEAYPEKAQVSHA